jgi:hypothetical protein
MSSEHHSSPPPEPPAALTNTYPAHLQPLMDALRSKYPESSTDRYEPGQSISSIYASNNIFTSSVRLIIQYSPRTLPPLRRSAVWQSRFASSPSPLACTATSSTATIQQRRKSDGESFEPCYDLLLLLYQLEMSLRNGRSICAPSQSSRRTTSNLTKSFDISVDRDSRRLLSRR